MSLPGRIIIGCWIAFAAYWFINARRVKGVAERKSLGSSMAYRIPLMIGSLLIFVRRLPEAWNTRVIPDADWARYGGAMVCVGGLLVAIWARVTLAGNWSSNVTFKQGHELIRTGPYRFVRHPIYTGILLMVLGTAIHIGALRSCVGFLFYFLGFWIKYRQEEKLMLQHFPEQYPVYKKQVKALVPWVF